MKKLPGRTTRKSATADGRPAHAGDGTCACDHCGRRRRRLARTAGFHAVRGLAYGAGTGVFTLAVWWITHR